MRVLFGLARGALLLLAFSGRLLPASEATTGAQIVARQFESMSTTIEIKLVARPEQAAAAEAALDRAEKEMEAFVDVVNSWDPRSDLSRVNDNAGVRAVKVDDRLMRLLRRAREFSELSGGAFDVTFFPLGMAWNVRSPQFVLPTPRQIADARALVDYRQLELDAQAGTAWLRRAGMKVEVGAIAKGAAVDVAARSLRASGFPNALVRASGDTLAMGDKEGAPWIVGIQHPREPHGAILGKLALRNRAITTSGDYEKFAIVGGKRYCHIVDPRSGRPADKTISVTVLAADAETADALSTTLFILGPEEGLKLCRQMPGVEALFVDPNERIVRTPGFPPFIGE